MEMSVDFKQRLEQVKPRVQELANQLSSAKNRSERDAAMEQVCGILFPFLDELIKKDLEKNWQNMFDNFVHVGDISI